MGPSGNPLSRSCADPAGDISAWEVHFRLGAESRVVAFRTALEATEAACRLIDGGGEVIDIETTQGTAAIDREQMAHVYARWSRARYH
jgi:hypothetical protein